MARGRQARAWEVEAAQQAALRAETVTQLRQSLAILIPALTGVSLEITADILGLSRNRINGLRRQFRSGAKPWPDRPVQRGGRRRALMSIEDELRFVAQWLCDAGNNSNDGSLNVATIHAAHERAIGRKVPSLTIYRLLARHGWRKNRPAD